MKSLKIAAFAAALSTAMLITATPAAADGNVQCGGGPQSGWKPISAAKKKAWQEGWTITKAQVEGDCYEIYARTEQGQAVEAFFHPVSLKKLLVKRRGQEIYRAPGFKG